MLAVESERKTGGRHVRLLSSWSARGRDGNAQERGHSLLFEVESIV